MCLEDRGQFAEVCSLFLLYRFQRPKTGHQAWCRHLHTIKNKHEVISHPTKTQPRDLAAHLAKMEPTFQAQHRPLVGSQRAQGGLCPHL